MTFYKALAKPRGDEGWGWGCRAFLPALLCVGVKRSRGEDEEVTSVVEEG